METTGSLLFRYSQTSINSGQSHNQFLVFLRMFPAKIDTQNSKFPEQMRARGET